MGHNKGEDEYVDESKILEESEVFNTINAYLIQNSLPEVAMGWDDQNGLNDPSMWIEFPSKHNDDIQSELEQIGFEFFLARNDREGKTISTYGIPVEKIGDLRPGDCLTLNRNEVYRVQSVETVNDGGPWERKKNLTMVEVTRIPTGTSRLLVFDWDSSDYCPKLYSESSKTSSGYTSNLKVITMHRNPRYSELTVESD